MMVKQIQLLMSHWAWENKSKWPIWSIRAIMINHDWTKAW